MKLSVNSQSSAVPPFDHQTRRGCVGLFAAQSRFRQIVIQFAASLNACVFVSKPTQTEPSHSWIGSCPFAMYSLSRNWMNCGVTFVARPVLIVSQDAPSAVIWTLPSEQ